MLVAPAYASLIALNRAASFRAKEESLAWIRTLADSAEALAIGLTTATII
jgi:hypothetical protein